jgi:hypothetical protein
VCLDLPLRPGKQLVQAVHCGSVLPADAAHQLVTSRSRIMLT